MQRFILTLALAAILAPSASFAFGNGNGDRGFDRGTEQVVEMSHDRDRDPDGSNAGDYQDDPISIETIAVACDGEYVAIFADDGVTVESWDCDFD